MARTRNLLAPINEAWREQAACKDKPTGLFYVGRGGSECKEAIAICNSCAVREECLEWALATNEPEGIWGGMGPQSRKNLRRQRRRKQLREEKKAS